MPEGYLYFNDGRCARLGIEYDPKTDNPQQIKTSTLVEVMYELDADGYGACVAALRAAFAARKQHLWVVPHRDAGPGFFQFSE